MSSLLAVILGLPLLQLGRRRSWLGRGDRDDEAEFVSVPDVTTLEHLIESSNDGSVVLFLHDPFCPVSARAHRRVSEAGGAVHLVNVSRQHDVKRAVEERTGVRHESPQAIVLRDGKPVWYASHGGVTTEGLVTARDHVLE